jgi:hypothetical protein
MRTPLGLTMLELIYVNHNIHNVGTYRYLYQPQLVTAYVPATATAQC